MVWRAIYEAHKLKRDRLTEAAEFEGKEFRGHISTCADFLIKSA